MNPDNRREGIRRAKRVLKIWDIAEFGSDWVKDLYGDGDTDGHCAKIMIHTRKVCSKDCCGNARKFDGPTRQERKSTDSMKVQLEEIEDI